MEASCSAGDHSTFRFGLGKPIEHVPVRQNAWTVGVEAAKPVCPARHGRQNEGLTLLSGGKTTTPTHRGVAKLGPHAQAERQTRATSPGRGVQGKFSRKDPRGTTRQPKSKAKALIFRMLKFREVGVSFLPWLSAPGTWDLYRLVRAWNRLRSRHPSGSCSGTPAGVIPKEIPGLKKAPWPLACPKAQHPRLSSPAGARFRRQPTPHESFARVHQPSPQAAPLPGTLHAPPGRASGSR